MTDWPDGVAHQQFRTLRCRLPYSYLSAVRAARRRDEQRPAPSRRKRWRQVRRRRRRRRRNLTLEDVVRDVALSAVDVPIGVADALIPDHGVDTFVAGLHRRVSRAPVARARWVFLGASGPRAHRQRGNGSCLGGATGQAKAGHRDTGR